MVAMLAGAPHQDGSHVRVPLHPTRRTARHADRRYPDRRTTGVVAKHGESMTTSCRLFQRRSCAGYEEGRTGMVRRLTAGPGRSPRDTAFVAFLLASSLAASRVGQETSGSRTAVAAHGARS